MKMLNWILFTFLFMMACEAEYSAIPRMGTLDLKVTVAPLCGIVRADEESQYPNNPCGLSDEAVNEIYRQYKVSISNSLLSAGFAPLERTLDRTGIVKTDLPVGTYKVTTILPSGIDMKQNKTEIEKSFTIKSDSVTVVSININTGYQ